MICDAKKWREWTEKDWEVALFRHFFVDDGSDHPVNRVPVTSDELIKVVSDPDANCREVEEAFLNSVRTPSHVEFNHKLAGYRIDPETGWKEPTIPPFFIPLIFSCLVASPPEGEIRNIGDFRKRLASLLGHDQPNRNYPLDRLALLWCAFSKWLDWRRSSGDPYRRLELPPLDSRVRIGYSINLAFPTRKDQITLVAVLSEGGFEGDPPIPAVFELVGKELSKFSPSLRRGYEEFRSAFNNKESDLERFPFWGAVRSAVASAQEKEIERDRDRRRFALVMEPGGVVLLLSNVPGDLIRDTVTFAEIDIDYGEFNSVLSVKHASSVDFYQATSRLLGGRYWKVLDGKGGRALKIALEQGLLLFRRSEGQNWRLIFTRQDEGEYQGLVVDSLAKSFLNAFPEGSRPHGKRSRYGGWTHIESFKGTLLGSLVLSEFDPLSQIRCLQAAVTGPRLFLVGGCPIDGGFLGIPKCLPLVRAPFSDSVSVIPAHEGDGRFSFQLIRRQNFDFKFPDNLHQSLKGAFRIVGVERASSRILVQKEVFFYSEIVVNAYARPKDQNAWEVEAGGPDVMTYSETSLGAPLNKESNRPKNLDTKESLDGPSRLTLLKVPVSTWPRMDGVHTSYRSHSVWEPGQLGRASEFMEVCGGLAMSRKGIPEADLLNLVRDHLGISQYGQQWDVVRSWVESGHLDRLHFKKWRRTEYYPRAPQFVLEEKKGHIRGVLFGLATAAFRNRADVELLGAGAEREPLVSYPEEVVPPPAWKTKSIDPYVTVSKLLGLEEPLWKRPLSETLWPFAQVVSQKKMAPPLYYECCGSWNWDRGWFSRDAKPMKRGVEVTRFQRPDRPSYYQVTNDGDDVWWSTSRNWALLLAHELRGETPFALAGSDQVVRMCKGQVYLPIPLGRYLTMTGVTPPGLSGEGIPRYIYQFRDARERQSFLSAFHGKVPYDKAEINRWGRWMLAMSRRSLAPGARVVPFPNSIRHCLEQFDDVPAIHELSRTMVDPSLLPRVREGLSRFTKSMENA